MGIHSSAKNKFCSFVRQFLLFKYKKNGNNPSHTIRIIRFFIEKKQRFCYTTVRKRSILAGRGDQSYMKKTIKPEEIIKKNTLFADCQLQEFDYQIASYKRGESVQDSLHGMPCVGIVLAGIVDVYSIAYDTSEINVSSLEQGAVFGICNIFLEQPMPTRLKCRIASKIMFISKDTFRALLQNHPDMLIRYAALCNAKIQYLANQLELTNLSSCASKLACYLLRNYEPPGIVHLKAPKEQIAKYLGTSRASLFRELASFQERGLIAITSDIISILDFDALKRI